MAKRKSDLTTRNMSNDIFINKEVTGVQSVDQPHSIDEQATLSGILNTQYKEKDSNLNKLSGARTVVTYYQQVPSGENNALVNMAGFSTSDPNLGRFIRIEDLSVRMDAIDMNYNETEGNGAKSVESEGKLIILPNTIKPNPNDRFSMKYLDRVRLYKITDVTPMSGHSESAYECTFMCEDYDFYFETSELRKQIMSDYIFDETYLGTNMRTVFEKSEYNTLLELKDIYLEIGKIYKREFWDEHLETFIVKYEDNLNIEGYKASNTYDAKLSKFEFKPIYGERDMYDGQLIDFMLKNRIFDSIEYFPTIPTQYSLNENTRIYKGTLFYALERRNRKMIRNRYQLPVELNIASPDSPPILYGKLNLIHVSSLSDYTVNLFPKDMCDIIMTQASEDVPVTQFDKDSFSDIIIYITALFINNKTKNIPGLIHAIYDKIYDLENFSEFIPTYQAFYLIPILGYITKEMANQIVSQNASDNEISDPVNTRRASI